MKELAVCISNDNQWVTPKETIDAIVDAGFKYAFVQWYNGDYKKFDMSQEEQLSYARSRGLNIIFAHLGYRNMNVIWEENEVGEKYTERYLNDIDAMVENNIDMVVMHICVGFDAPAPNSVGLKRFKRIVEYAKSKNIKIAFENTKLKGYQEFILDNIDEDNIGICYDSGHAHCHFKDDFNYSKFKDRIMCVHIHDNYGELDDHLLPYDGTLDFDRVLDGLHEANYNNYCTLELCYRRDYLNKYSVSEFYKKGYEIGLKLKKKYEERL